MYVLNQFIPSNAMTQLKRNGFLEVKEKEKTLEENGNQILKRKQATNISCSQKTGEQYGLDDRRNHLIQLRKK